MSTCAGAINVFEDGDFHMQFTGEKSDENGVEAYPSLGSITTSNLVWISFIAPINGELTFRASKNEGYLQMVVFEEVQNDICAEIGTGESEIKRLHLGKEDTVVGLNYEIGGGVLYSLPLRKGKKIHIMFATNEGSTEELHLIWEFVQSLPSDVETKVVDKRYDEFSPTFRIIVKDSETNLPLIANLSLEGSKELDGLYVGSEFLFNVDRNCNLNIKCDVEGYFFSDREESVSSFDDQELIVLLERVASGKSMQIEEIEFTPGTSEITSSSEPKLKRLKDFLALNSDLKIQIEGHVFALGKNSTAGQKISEARAKRVMKYLIDNGIAKDRLSAIGYGNTRPVFPEPQFSYEEQANRRVEIVVQ
ncbi:MAG: outer membrane protein OmpA-like peptidoglycan-associated protein [Crocinitomicaceae bacterium]|jgi:outer membrane protein OmpA-like peptidoglycan-associated protein